MKKYVLFQYENLNFQFFPKVLLRFGVVAAQHQTLANLTKTLAKKSKIKISYRNNAYFFIHHRVISKHHLVVVYTKFEVKRSILEGCRPIQTENPVFETLTLDWQPTVMSLHIYNPSFIQISEILKILPPVPSYIQIFQGDFGGLLRLLIGVLHSHSYINHLKII